MSSELMMQLVRADESGLLGVSLELRQSREQGRLLNLDRILVASKPADSIRSGAVIQT